jgi:drug/metabolite transporter (DMT)-like permease
LAVIGSVLVFLLFLVVLQYWTASRASYGFVLIPIVTLLLSAWLDDEAISTSLVLGGLLILTGVYVGALRPARITAGSADHEADHP